MIKIVEHIAVERMLIMLKYVWEKVEVGETLNVICIVNSGSYFLDAGY